MQATLENAIAAITGERVTLTAAGRTDAGAHASEQVVAFSSTSALPARNLQRALNKHLPRDVAVTSVEDMPESFHPRFDARSRIYRYLIWNRDVRSPFWHQRAAHIRTPLDEQRMDAALRQLEGRHDVGAFIPRRHAGDRVREVFRARCWREGDIVAIELEATGFLRQMVRAIAGTAIQVGRGILSEAEFADVLASRDRERAGVTAPACGLYLTGVRYEPITYPVNPSPAEARSPQIATPAFLEEIR